MSQIEGVLICRLDKNGEKFEILVDPKKGYEYKLGHRSDFSNVLMADEVFKDANKGERHTAASLKKAFHTESMEEIAKIIIKEGDLQITTDQKRKLIEEKKAKLTELIARNAIDPRNKTPHPPLRIQNALDEARFHLDPFKSAEEQMEDAIDSIREIIPISLEKMKIAVKVPAEFAGRAYGTLKEYGIKKEEYGNDGSLVAMVEIPAGLRGEFYDRLNKLTSGSVQTKVL
ncbi:MAG: ribosome assembly factor SBDS [Candidatus Micrarchaeota archaeon]